MILITLGSREYQFDRLLKKVDVLISEKKIKQDVFAQIGQSTYIPVNYEYERFLSFEKFSEMQDEADIVITHGGTGAMVSALKKNKKTIAVPRLSKFDEHIDDHQLQVASMLDKNKYLIQVVNLEELHDAIEKLTHSFKLKEFKSSNSIVPMISNYLKKV